MRVEAAVVAELKIRDVKRTHRHRRRTKLGRRRCLASYGTDAGTSVEGEPLATAMHAVPMFVPYLVANEASSTLTVICGTALGRFAMALPSIEPLSSSLGLLSSKRYPAVQESADLLFRSRCTLFWLCAKQSFQRPNFSGKVGLRSRARVPCRNANSKKGR